MGSGRGATTSILLCMGLFSRFCVKPLPALAAAPADRRPDPFVKVIPDDLGDELKPRDGTSHRHLAGQEPADREGVERSQGSPADGFEHRPRMCLGSAE